MTFGYDGMGRAASKVTKTGGTTQASYTWTRNRAGQVLSEASTITSDPTNDTRQYTYDPLGRLATSTDASTTTYGWDAVPNRTGVQAGGGPNAPTTYNAANRPVNQNGVANAFTTDADGRITARPDATGASYQRFTWDHLGRLLTVLPPTGNTPVATNTYDPLDRLRMVDYGGGNRVRFRYLGMTTSVVQEIDDATGTVTRNIGNSWTGEHLEDWTSPGLNLRVYGTNVHGDETWTAGSTGSVTGTVRYDPYGAVTSVTGSVSDFRFQGSWADDTTKLSWVVARWYAPTQGDFISEDSLLGQPRDPDSRHLYAYAQGDPVGSQDPDGRYAITFSKWRVTSQRVWDHDSCGGVHNVDAFPDFTAYQASWEAFVYTDTCMSHAYVDYVLTSNSMLIGSRIAGWRLRFAADNLSVQKADDLIAGIGGAKLEIDATLLRARVLALEFTPRPIGSGIIWSQISEHVGLGWHGFGGIDFWGSFQRRPSSWSSDGFVGFPYALSSCGQMGCLLTTLPNGNLYFDDLVQVKVHVRSEVFMIGFGSYWTDTKLSGLRAVLQPW